METKFGRSAAAAARADALIVFGGEDKPVSLGLACDATLSELQASGECKGKSGEFTVLHNPPGLNARRLVVAGLGKQSDTASIRKASGAAVRHLKSKECRRVAIWLGEGQQSPAMIAAATEAAMLGDYEPDRLKSEPSKGLESLEVLAPDAPGEAESAFARAVVLAESQNFARDLGNEPANVLNPIALANRARLMADQTGLEAEVVDEDRMRQLGMGSLLGVAQGSSEPPVLIILRYRPEQPNGSGIHLGLVGKGVTFDSGGISIKPAENMEKMKYDMCGAAAVLGAMRAISHLKPGIAVTALVPSVENMLSGRSQRPGDIVRSLGGKTVEVLNTDAEGRLILNDAITYAQRLGCTHLVDAATLTGSVVVALGHIYTGAYTNDPELLGRVMEAAKAEDEKIWQMPLEEDYKEALKSAFADLANIGTRWGGSITAAWFLREFADPTPWVHLDIAGTAYLEEAKPWMAKGPTGVCVRTFAQLASAW
jgi:leucyl aminopeptidase